MKVNILELCGTATPSDRLTLRDYETRREGMTVFTRKRKPGDIWVVGRGSTTIDDILACAVWGDDIIAGGWYSELHGKYLWEEVQAFSSKEDALHYAELRGEQCIFNLETGEEVYV